MITETDLIGDKKPFPTNRPFLNEGEVKFLQIKQDITRQKHKKR